MQNTSRPSSTQRLGWSAIIRLVVFAERKCFAIFAILGSADLAFVSQACFQRLNPSGNWHTEFSYMCRVSVPRVPRQDIDRIPLHLAPGEEGNGKSEDGNHRDRNSCKRQCNVMLRKFMMTISLAIFGATRIITGDAPAWPRLLRPSWSTRDQAAPLLRGLNELPLPASAKVLARRQSLARLELHWQLTNAAPIDSCLRSFAPRLIRHFRPPWLMFHGRWQTHITSVMLVTSAGTKVFRNYQRNMCNRQSV